MKVKKNKAKTSRPREKPPKYQYLAMCLYQPPETGKRWDLGGSLYESGDSNSLLYFTTILLCFNTNHQPERLDTGWPMLTVVTEANRD
jgi:hypothetical protein